MNKFRKLSLALVPFFICSSLYAQGISLPDIALDAQYMGPHKVITWATKSIPPHFGYRIEGYDFQVQASIITQGDSSFEDSLFGLVCILPDHSVTKYFFVHDQIIKCSDHEYQYSFPLRISESAWVTIFIASRQEIESDTYPGSYEHTSNKETLYLDAH
jgi:hypothetical protein